MRELCTVALGGVEEDSLREIEACVVEHLGCAVRRLPPMALPAGSFDEQRGQWSSVLLLRHLLAVAPEGCLRVLGVTECDLFIPMLTFVFGQAQLDGLAALKCHAQNGLKKVACHSILFVPISIMVQPKLKLPMALPE